MQIGITLVGILTGAFGGATLRRAAGRGAGGRAGAGALQRGPRLRARRPRVTYLSLVFGELVPKRLALQQPRADRVARRPPVPALSRLAGPAVAVLGASTDAALRLLGVRPPAEAPVTEAEIRLLLGQGAEAGVFEPGEQDLVAGVLSLADRQVGELMTPRTRLVALDLDAPPEVNARKMAESPHTHFPVYRRRPRRPGRAGVRQGRLGRRWPPRPGAGAPAAGRPRGAPARAAPGELERVARPPSSSRRPARPAPAGGLPARGRAGGRPGRPAPGRPWRWPSSSASTGARRA